MAVTKKILSQYDVKRCSRCGIEKPLYDFNKDCTRLDGYCYICKECNKEKGKKYYRSHIDRIREKRETQKDKRAAYDKEYYKKNKEHKLAKNKQWRQTHPEIKRAYNKMYWENNKERLNEQAKAYNRKRKQEDPMYKLKCKVRGMLRDSFRRKGFQKPSPSEEILGCSVEEFQEHLKQTWESKYNTKWDGQPCHIDHVIPLATANTEQEIIRLCHYTNLRLLTPEDNLAKRAQYEQ